MIKQNLILTNLNNGSLSVPVEKTDKKGRYECDLIISDADAKELAKLMQQAFKESAKVQVKLGQYQCLKMMALE